MFSKKVGELIDESITNFIQDYDVTNSLYNRVSVLNLMIEHWQECPNCVGDPDINILLVHGIEKLFIMKSELALMN